MAQRTPQTYRGSCHCGAVRFEVETEFPELSTCNCSICRRKNALMVKVHETKFKLLAGDQTDDDTAARYLNQLGSRAERGQALAAAGMHDQAEVGKRVGATNPSSIQKTFGRASAESFANVVLESDRRLKTGKTRSPSEQLQDVIIRQARKTRGH